MPAPNRDFVGVAGGYAHSLGLKVAFRCGDGLVIPGEECDDGNVDPGDGCDEDCQMEYRAIPTASVWGLAVMTLLLLTGGKIAFGRLGEPVH